jgi:hypothetical protein
VVKIDPAIGASTMLSDFGDPSQGPINPLDRGTRPNFSSLAIEGTAIVVLDGFFGTNAAGALFSVDPATGLRTIISDFGDAEWHNHFPGGMLPTSLAIEPSGDLLVLSESPFAVVRVERSAGTPEIVSSSDHPGPSISGAFSIAVEESGQIVVGSVFSGSNNQGAVFRIDPLSGTRTMLSDFGDPARGPTGRADDLTIDHHGNLLVASTNLVTGGGGLFRVDPLTGSRVVVSGLTGQGVAVEETDDILLGAARPVGRRDLVRIDPVTGSDTQLVVVNFRDAAVVRSPLVNGFVSLSLDGTDLDPMGGPRAPAGTFRITATFLASAPIRSPFFRVQELSGGNLLVNGDRPPVVAALSGKGARLTPGVGPDGVLMPGDSVTVEFDIGLQTRQPFSFFVNVFGESESVKDAP